MIYLLLCCFEDGSSGLSLFSAEYIQSTGRGGRDGNGCCCTIFFRSEDFTLVKKVIQFESLPDDEKKRRDVAISNVFKVRVSLLKSFVFKASHFWLICPLLPSVRYGRATMPKTDVE